MRNSFINKVTRVQKAMTVANNISLCSTILVVSLGPRLHVSGQIFARTNFVPGQPVYMDPCRIRANSVAVVFTRIHAKYRPVAAFDSRP